MRRQGLDDRLSRRTDRDRLAFLNNYLRAILIRGSAEDLLWRRPPRPVRPDAYHPDEQHEDDDEDDGAGDAAGDVGERRLLLAELAGERAGALAVRRALLVLQADALVAAVILASVCKKECDSDYEFAQI